MTLEPYEEEVLLAMFDHELIGANYKAIEKVCSMIKWIHIARKYSVKKSCSKVLRHLASKGYVDLHGKAGNVASLTKFGVDYVMGKRETQV
jgi:ribosomal protein S25